MKFLDIETDKQRKYISNEITLMKSLSHPNILKIDDAIMNEKTMYMFMEFMDGGSLTDIIVSNERKLHGYNENVIAFILVNIANGLKYLHENNIIHRDIKSDNILLKRNTNDIKICDFGYAQQLTKE